MKLILLAALILCSACAQLTPEQQAELTALRQQVLSAEAGIRTHAQELEQARKDFQAGKLTQEQLNALVLKSQDQVAALVATAQASSTKVSDLQKQGVPPWQSFWEAGGREILIGLGGAWLVKRQNDSKKEAVTESVAKVEEIRGPITARKGVPPKGAV